MLHGGRETCKLGATFTVISSIIWSISMHTLNKAYGRSNETDLSDLRITLPQIVLTTTIFIVKWQHASSQAAL